MRIRRQPHLGQHRCVMREVTPNLVRQKPERLVLIRDRVEHRNHSVCGRTVSRRVMEKGLSRDAAYHTLPTAAHGGSICRLTTVPRRGGTRAGGSRTVSHAVRRETATESSPHPALGGQQCTADRVDPGSSPRARPRHCRSNSRVDLEHRSPLGRAAEGVGGVRTAMSPTTNESNPRTALIRSCRARRTRASAASALAGCQGKRHRASGSAPAHLRRSGMSRNARRQRRTGSSSFMVSLPPLTSPESKRCPGIGMVISWPLDSTGNGRSVGSRGQVPPFRQSANSKRDWAGFGQGFADGGGQRLRNAACAAFLTCGTGLEYETRPLSTSVM